MTYLQDETTTTGVDDLKGIWVASDTPEIADEVRTLAPAYFPNVPREAIVYVGHGVAGSGSSTVQVCSPALGRLISHFSLFYTATTQLNVHVLGFKS